VGFAALVTLIVTFAGDMAAARLRGLAGSDAERSAVLSSWIGATVAISFVAAVALIPLAGTIATVIWSAPGRTDLALLSIILIPIAAGQAALASVLRIVGRPLASAGVAVLDLVAQIGVAVPLVLLGAGAEGLVLGFIIGSGVGLIGAGAVAAPHLRTRPRVDLARRVVVLGAAFLPVGTIFIATEYVIRFLLVELKGPSQVGYLAVAIRLSSAMLLVSAAFSLAWGPYGLSRRPGPATARLFGVVLKVFGSVALLAGLLVGALAPEVVALISGSAYLPAAGALPGMVLAAATSGIFFIVVVGAGVRGSTRAIPLSALAGGVIQIAATWLTVREFGLVGVGCSALLGRLCSLTLLMLASRDAVHIPTWPIVLGLASAGTAVALSIATFAPSETRPLRLLVAVAVAGAAIALARSWLRPRGVLRDLRRVPR
jgi:O-antigen/teichoic acid export membrane protein